MIRHLTTNILAKSHLETLRYLLSFDDLSEDTRKNLQEEIQQIENILKSHSEQI